MIRALQRALAHALLATSVLALGVVVIETNDANADPNPGPPMTSCNASYLVTNCELFVDENASMFKCRLLPGETVCTTLNVHCRRKKQERDVLGGGKEIFCTCQANGD